MNGRRIKFLIPDKPVDGLERGAKLVGQVPMLLLGAALRPLLSKAALLPFALSLALASLGCSSPPEGPDEDRAPAGTLAGVAPERVEARRGLPTAPAASNREPVAARQILDVAAYALRNGYYQKNGWWWRDDGYGVLHALFDQGSHYGIGLMMSPETSEARSKLAIDHMGTTLYHLELGSQFALDVMNFYSDHLNRYAEVLDAEYSASTVLHGREVEVSFWWSEGEFGSAVGTMMVIEKP